MVCHNDLSPKNTVYRDGARGCGRWRSSTGTSPRPASGVAGAVLEAHDWVAAHRAALDSALA
ncbi:hypothetical protein C1I98_20610 [Spongiactinospora gelatinilytica]|uniref:Uncharacterized protein n=1 Tax=Spongiactinospora gelatinilytica TaxID=2666298 RepID=A0A2W2GW87_9ACTN|nr:hypothetical protein [Spongiactinospora gelatinilytica]PZG41860.1 hypothetical protein C1I98_20610 [Spongiactinospora gelatinilytica]